MTLRVIGLAWSFHRIAGWSATGVGSDNTAEREEDREA